jgi:glucose-1-phosphate adenylyltransferase
MNILAMILAGGEGKGFGVLTANRSEPAVPFGGKYRLIDFSLSNCVNSNIFNVAILTQFQPRSLVEHIGLGKPWDLDRARGGVRILQPYQSSRSDRGAWQEGTADAVRFNLDFVGEQKPDHVLILAGDHIYKMDYQPFLQQHIETNADVTIAARLVSPTEAHRFGMITLDENNRVTAFEEKPKVTRSSLASMGVYIFRREFLVEYLRGTGVTQRDFGRDVIPALVESGRVYAYTFRDYWADVGTIQAYFEANMMLLNETPALDLYDPDWVIHTKSEGRPAAYIGPEARVEGNLLCDGCRIDGTVIRSIVAPGVYVAPGAVVRDSILMNDVRIGDDAIVDRAILDKKVTVGRQARVGDSDDNTPNQNTPERLNTGITVVGKHTTIPDNLVIGRNVEIGAYVKANTFTQNPVPSGTTI